MDEKSGEKELIQLYKEKVNKKTSEIKGLTGVAARAAAERFFSEYEKRFLSGEVKPEDEEKKDIWSNVHKLAKEGKLPHPDELGEKIEAFFMNQMGQGMFALGEDSNQLFVSVQKEEPINKKNIEEKLKFDYKPQDIVNHLDKCLVGQEDAKKALATAVFYHYNAVKQELKGNPIKDYQKKNIVLIGKAGIGKTTLVKKIAELLNVPFGRFDASQFSPTGIVGKDATGIIGEMVQKANMNKQLAEYGIVFIDEFDKLVKEYGVGGGRSHSYGTDIQATFLKILEDEPIDILPDYHPIKMLMPGAAGKLRTKYMLFIVAGAFDGLDEIVERRINKKEIGFRSEKASKPEIEKHELFLQATHQDLVEYGFLTQLAGRLPVITALHELNAGHLYAILTKAENNVLSQYQQQISSATGAKISFDDAALKEISERAYKMGTGARGIITVCETILEPLMFELPNYHNINEIVIGKEGLDDPKNILVNSLKEKSLADYQKAFTTTYGINLTFADEARKSIQFDMKDPQKLNNYLNQKLEVLPSALNLIGKNEFTIISEFLENPVTYLENHIKGIRSQR